MPKITTKPIVMINGSRSLNNIHISRFIRPSSCAAIVSGGANGVDLLAEKWAKENNLEFVAFPAQWSKYGKRAGMMRNEDMVNFSDVLISFWDGKSPGTLHAINYALSLGRKVIVHLFIDLD